MRGRIRPVRACSCGIRRPSVWSHSLCVLQDFLSGFEVCRPGTHAHRPQEGYVEGAVDSPVKVSVGRRDTALPLEYPQVVGCYAELSSSLRYVYYAVHLNLEDS
jgi:hypothetical protein